MLDNIALILTSVGAGTAVALLRRRARPERSAVLLAPVCPGAGARHLADALCAAAAEPLRVAGPHWKSLAEMVQTQTSERLD